MAIAKVLLVDDEVEFTDVLSMRMETRGFDVDTADTGTKAVEMVGRILYDAIILDLAMPGMDGLETLKSILQKTPDSQVILLTGRATVEKSVEAMKLGAAEFLEKPADINTLVGKIKEAQSKKIDLFERRIEDSIARITRKKSW